MGRSCGMDVEEAKPVVIMVIVQVIFAGANIFFKIAASDGMNLRLLVAYRFVFATAFMAPIAFFLERKKRPKLTWMILFQSFICALLGGTLGQNLYLESLALTSVTYASALSNLIPGMTFILAVSLGLEKLNWGTRAGKEKVAGTLLGIGGAMLLTFYKGIELKLWSTNVNILHNQNSIGSGLKHSDSSHLLLGSLLAICGCLAYSLWLILQTKMGETYPCHCSSTALMSFMASIQNVVVGLCTERDWNQWKLGWNIRLLTVAYSGIIATGLSVTLMVWCGRKKGALFTAVFSPLMLVLIAIASSLLLDEKLHLGCVLGAGLIVCGLYVVLWGKGKEIEAKDQNINTPPKISIESSPVAVVVNN